jgi:branched-chain amino acid transport system ATP-binding protein
MARPTLILMDEPSMGLSPLLVKEVFGIIRQLNRDLGITILLVEQNAERAFAVADRVAVMSLGEIVLRGTPAELAADPRFDAAYFGIGMAEAAR